MKRCIHHWHINNNDVGVCIKCGGIRDFGKLQHPVKIDLKLPTVNKRFT